MVQAIQLSQLDHASLGRKVPLQRPLTEHDHVKPSRGTVRRATCSATCDRMDLICYDILARYGRRSSRWADRGREDADGRCFTCAVGSEKPEDSRPRSTVNETPSTAFVFACA
jgi:hypothetical protein